MSLDQYDFDLPQELIAQEPAADRDASRALFGQRGQDGIEVGEFRELAERLRGDECLVVNDTRVIPARLRARRKTGGAVEVFLLRQETTDVWRAWLSPSRRIQVGEVLEVAGADLEVGEREGSFWRVRLPGPELIERCGEVPLPPYIERSADDPRRVADRERYQTIFASASGAVAAPTAGLHFTPELVELIRARGVPIVPVTLHVGPGTFEPIRAARLEDHRVSAELFSVSAETREALSEARRDGRRIVAVGTTSTRVLESLPAVCADPWEAGPTVSGETDLTILPGHQFQLVEGMITNFHLPRSSLLVLVSAFQGRERVLASYQRAVADGLRFYSYGDAMVILPGVESC